MEGEIILKGFGLLGTGMLFVWFGVTGWRNRRGEHISLIESMILKLTDSEPLPLSRWDRSWAYIQPMLFLVSGPLMVLGGIVILAS
jgi:hypothetical protein